MAASFQLIAPRSPRSLTPDSTTIGVTSIEANAPVYVIATSRFVLLPLAHLLTGYTVKAMQGKIDRAQWREDREWFRAPDGRIHIDMLGYEKWVSRR